MNNTNPKVDDYLGKIKNWQKETEQLRSIALSCKLTEELKWGKPCYTSQNGNIAIIQGFKDFCALLFFKGALLQDPEGILQKVGPNSQSGRQIRFTSAREIADMAPIVKTYIRQAVEVEKSGLKVESRKSPEPVPAELQSRLNAMPALKRAFAALTPGRQRAYILFFSAPKQSKTRTSRVEKCVPRILEGKGLND